MFGLLIAIFGFLTGFLVDVIGVGWSLIIGNVISLACAACLTREKITVA